MEKLLQKLFLQKILLLVVLLTFSGCEMIRSGFTFQYSLPDTGGGDSPEPIEIAFEHNGVDYVYSYEEKTVSFVDGEGETQKFDSKADGDDTYFWKQVNCKYVYFKVDSNDDIYYDATGDINGNVIAAGTIYVNGTINGEIGFIVNNTYRTIYVNGNVNGPITQNCYITTYILGNVVSSIKLFNNGGKLYVSGEVTGDINNVVTAKGAVDIVTSAMDKYIQNNIDDIIADIESWDEVKTKLIIYK